MTENIPEELKQLNQWTCYVLGQARENGKQEKIPKNPLTGQPAKSNAPDTWVSFDEALMHVQSYDGLGFFFSETDEHCGIDIDYCVESYNHFLSNPELTQEAKQIVANFNSYTEISPSNKGIHIIIKGKLPEWSQKKIGNYEAYDHGRFFTMTGDIFDNRKNISEGQEYLEEFCRQYLLKNKQDSNYRYQALMEGRWKELGFPSQSEADMSLATYLVNMIGPDLGKIETQMSNSGLYRDKFNNFDKQYGTYLKRTIIKAIENNKNFSKERSIVDELNQKHAVVSINGSCLVLNEYIDPINGHQDISLSKFRDLRNMYLNKTEFINNSKPENIADVWLRSPKRRQYEGIVFSPGKEHENYYNLYRGWKLKPCKGDWSLFKKHIYEVISGSNQDIYDYVIAWMAHAVQYPGSENKPGVSIILQGKQGTGKGIFVTNYGKLFEPHFLHLSSAYQLTGRFNSFLKDKILVFADESIWTGNNNAAGILKTMITENTLYIEPKGQNGFSIRNYIRLIMSSNNDWVVPAGLEERRFFVLEVSDKYMGNHDYFKAIMDQMNNGGREAMLFDLLRVDLSAINLKNFPRTNALMKQIEMSMPLVQKWWFYRLLSGAQLTSDDSWQDKVPNASLYNDYKEFVADSGRKEELNKIAFGREVKKLCPLLKDTRLIIDNHQEPAKSFPILTQCRDQFEALVKIKVDWNNF